MTVFVDSNVPMYLVGAAHPNREAAVARLDNLISRDERLVTDAEVLQEIIHRYVAIDRTDAIQPAFDAVLAVVDEVLPVDRDIAVAAKTIVLGRYGLSARDALHAAAMQAHGITRILTFDKDFDRFPGLERLS